MFLKEKSLVKNRGHLVATGGTKKRKQSSEWIGSESGRTAIEKVALRSKETFFLRKIIKK